MRSVFIIGFLLITSSLAFTSVFDQVRKEAEAVETFKNAILEIKDVLFEFLTTLESTADLHKRKYQLLHLLETAHIVGEDKVCSACKTLFSRAETFTDSNLAYEILSPIALDICANMYHEDSTICQEAIAIFAPVVMQAVAVKAFNPERACANLLLCKEDWERETVREYINEVLADKPNIPIPTPTGRATYQALHVTDLHVDLFYEEGTNSNCDYFICCRDLSGPAPNASQSAGYWATPDSETCDIPMRTVDQMLQYVARNFDVDVVIWTGDNIAHDIFYQTAFNLTEQTFIITQAFDKYLVSDNPNVKIFPIQGNHEGSPVNIFNYYDNSTAWIVEQLSTIWSGWLDDEAIAQMNSTGFYSLYDADKNLRVIAIDTQACNTGNYLLLENPTDPYDQLEFIRDQLYLAESRNESVFFIGHIPMAQGGCNYAWTTRFEALIERFAHIARAQFYGHTHHDAFTLHRSLTDNSPINVQYVAPSMTTRSYINPSFRIYEVDADTNFIVDIKQYHLNATKWNNNHTGPIDFDLFYTFTESYGVPDMTFTTLDTLVDEFLEDPDQVSLYIYNQNTGYFPEYYLSEDSTMHVYCSCKEGNVIQEILCLGPEYAGYGDVYTLLSDDVFGTWRTSDDATKH